VTKYTGTQPSSQDRRVGSRELKCLCPWLHAAAGAHLRQRSQGKRLLQEQLPRWPCAGPALCGEPQ